ncbi:FirrV-1-B3 [Feldmannia irregularis virus a]|uniref:FirrV-1-B3 n=1 Tax=Feldmannia irregularis virus a TaxID=231992 RepID=Q6XM33_9PHYC|nr:FirrV-1-B3 [Feldmannia irregularis virus a]AAR26878.1 FirrV-1-B3 [Feldmannia irregularis virus a]
MDSEKILHRLLGDFGLDGPIRVDGESGLCSVIDVIQLVSQKSKPYARVTFRNVIQDDLQREGGNAPTFSEKIKHVKINNKGHRTPVGNATTIIELIWMLPGRNAMEIARQSAQLVLRYHMGDRELAQQVRTNSFHFKKNI